MRMTTVVVRSKRRLGIDHTRASARQSADLFRMRHIFIDRAFQSGSTAPPLFADKQSPHPSRIEVSGAAMRSLSFRYFTVSFAVVLCVSPPDVPMKVRVEVPFDAPLGTAKSTVTLAISSPEASVTDDGMTVQFEFGGPPLQLKLITPWNPVFEESVRVKTAICPGGIV